MKKFFEFYRVARYVADTRAKTFSYVPQRGVKFNEPLKWVRPEKKPHYHPECSGDLAPMPKIKPDSPYLKFKDSKELATANDCVKKIFSLGLQNSCSTYKMYLEELLEKVRNHPLDNTSLEARIAKLTAQIRYWREIIMTRPSGFPRLRIGISIAIQKRKKLLKFLRRQNYKKFEWLLETLDLEYRPVPDPNPAVTRKQSLKILAKLKVEQNKEEKLGSLKKSFDEQKVPFLEHKIKKLKEIKAKEEKYNLPVTVTDADIEECIKKLEEVKIEVEERLKKTYVRKIHPYHLEPYDEKLLLEKEKAGEKIREIIIEQKQMAGGIS